MGNRLKLGDQVWGVVPVEQQGCHAGYVVVDNTLVNNNIINKRKNESFNSKRYLSIG